jgi:hypothetical protein
MAGSKKRQIAFGVAGCLFACSGLLWVLFANNIPIGMMNVAIGMMFVAFAAASAKKTTPPNDDPKP